MESAAGRFREVEIRGLNEEEVPLPLKDILLEPSWILGSKEVAFCPQGFWNHVKNVAGRLEAKGKERTYKGDY